MTNTIILPRSVVEQALEALETGIQYDYHGNPYSDNDAARCVASDALRAALEQPVEQEPIAWANINKQGDITHTSNKKMAWAKTPLYTHPQPPRQPLTNDERQDLYAKAIKATNDDQNLSWRDAIVSETEHAHGIGGEA